MGRRLTLAVAAGGAAFAGASWLLARRVAGRLISSRGLDPVPTLRQNLLASLAGSGARVHDFRCRGAAADPIEIAAVFAQPSAATPSPRGTIVFLHGKGGNAAEWQPDALRAVSQGYSVLLPELRGHRPSGGEFVTYGYLERDDLSNTIAFASSFGLDAGRIGLHSCSAGSAVALAWAAENPQVRGLWLESPFANAREMAHHYLSLLTGIPGWALRLTTHFAVARALRSVRRSLALPPETPDPAMDSLAAAARIRAPVYLVFGDRDELVPPRFTRRLAEALPPGTTVWNPLGAGHCHHDDEPETVAAEEYAKRWTEFFAGALA